MLRLRVLASSHTASPRLLTSACRLFKALSTRRSRSPRCNSTPRLAEGPSTRSISSTRRAMHTSDDRAMHEHAPLSYPTLRYSAELLQREIDVQRTACNAVCHAVPAAATGAPRRQLLQVPVADHASQGTRARLWWALDWTGDVCVPQCEYELESLSKLCFSHCLSSTAGSFKLSLFCLLHSRR